MHVFTVKKLHFSIWYCRSEQSVYSVEFPFSVVSLSDTVMLIYSSSPPSANHLFSLSKQCKVLRSIYGLLPSVLHKQRSFEMICKALMCEPDEEGNTKVREVLAGMKSKK